MLAQINTQTKTQFQPLGYYDGEFDAAIGLPLGEFTSKYNFQYYDGEFDAAIGLPPQTNSGDY